VNEELLLALDQLEKEKGISKDLLVETIEVALITAYKKNYGTSQNVRIVIDTELGDFKVFSAREVVDECYDNFLEIDIEEAKEIDPNYVAGDIIEQEVTPKEFGRIAAQTAKQVIVQKIREAERSVIYDKFSDRESEIVTGEIERIAKGNVFINLGRTEAVLLPSEQIPGETYQQGGRIKTYIVEVSKTTKGPQVVVSRTHPGLVKRLFELEVPEIYNGEVEIRSISREAGSRTKIAVYSPNPDLDPVGSCVGPKGARVQSVVDELQGEKIDIVKWSDDPVELISNALSPSKVEKVQVSENEKSALVVVPDYQLSLAIGKEGQNARLAAKLTGWKIDIKSSTQYKEMLAKQKSEVEEEATEE
jgi:N utilization substance protein A